MLSRRWLCLYTMLLTFTCIIVVFLLVGIVPFGDKTMLTGDLGGVYMPFSHYVGSIEDPSLFSFSKGLGGGIQGLTANVPISPYIILLRWVPLEGVGAFFSYLILLKLVVASGTMAFFLSTKTKGSWITVILGFCYAFMSYNMVYASNTMWMDNIVMLPLILCAFERMVETKKIVLFSVLLALTIVFNYYTAFMICLFLILYFVWSMTGKIDVKRKDITAHFVRLASGGILAVGLSMVVLLPTALQTIQNKGIGGGIAGFTFSLREFFRQFIYCGFTWDQLENGLPLIYGSYLLIAGVLLYFSKAERTKREKICSAGLFAVLFLSFWIAPLNRIWHLFRDPVWFPFRYSFLFVAFAVILSALAFETIGTINKKRSVFFAVGTAFLAITIALTQYGVISTKKILVTMVLLFTIALLVYLVFKKINSKWNRVAAFLLGFVVVLELTFNAYYTTNLFELRNNETSRDYFRNIVSLKDEIQDDRFYRLEKDDMFSLNDPMLFGLRGLNHFSSLADATSEDILESLGYSGLYKNGVYSTRAGNALLSHRYLIGKTPYTALSGYQKIRETGEYSLYQEDHMLPFVFQVSSIDAALTTNPFDNTESIYSAILGRDMNLFDRVDYTDENGVFSVKAKDADSYYIYCIPKTDGSFLAVDGVDYGKADVQSGIMQIIPLGFHEKDFEFSINCDNLEVYRLNEAAFSEALEAITRTSPETNTIKNGSVEFFAQTKGTYLLSMPYYKDWDVFVDGVKKEPTPIYENFLGVEVDSENAVVSLRYSVNGLLTGAVITGVSLVLVVGLAVLEKKRTNKFKEHRV